MCDICDYIFIDAHGTNTIIGQCGTTSIYSKQFILRLLCQPEHKCMDICSYVWMYVYVFITKHRIYVCMYV